MKRPRHTTVICHCGCGKVVHVNSILFKTWVRCGPRYFASKSHAIRFNLDEAKKT